jgi:hypothetical protein
MLAEPQVLRGCLWLFGEYCEDQAGAEYKIDNCPDYLTYHYNFVRVYIYTYYIALQISPPQLPDSARHAPGQKFRKSEMTIGRRKLIEVEGRNE